MLQKDDNDWVKKRMEYEVVGSRPPEVGRRGPWLEVEQRDCQVCGLSKDDAMVRGRCSTICLLYTSDAADE